MALNRKHTEVECRECHFNELKDKKGNPSQNFANLEVVCVSCHENVHGETFAIDGVTDCKRCHDPESWFPKRFNHDITDFPLEGEHAKVECNACHEVTAANGEREVIYKLHKFRCIDCHFTDLAFWLYSNDGPVATWKPIEDGLRAMPQSFRMDH